MRDGDRGLRKDDRDMIYAAPVLAGAYKGKDISDRTLLWHAVSDQPIAPPSAFGRLRRGIDQALCNRSVDLADDSTWQGGAEITCSRCLEIVKRATRTR